MNLHIDQHTIQELKNGYYFDSQQRQYCCMLCQKRFTEGEIFPIDGRFFEASCAIEIHMRTEHPNLYTEYLYSDNKYISFTEHQKKLLEQIHKGLSDNEIAKQLNVSPSTIRHQKFMFREKAKQAKMYLSIYELTTEEKKSIDSDQILPISDNANMVDERFIITQEEYTKICSLVFSSMKPLKLKQFSKKEKRKIVILTEIAKQFEVGKHYQEREVNQILSNIFDDYATLRRYLVEYGFLERTRDCSDYWLK